MRWTAPRGRPRRAGPGPARRSARGTGSLAARSWSLVGWTGLVASALYLTGQGDILASAVLGFPVWDLGGLLGSTLWGLWVLALGVAVLRRPALQPATGPAGDSALAPTA